MSVISTISGWLSGLAEAPFWTLALLKITVLLGLAWSAHLGLGQFNPRWRVLLWRGVAPGLIAVPVAMLLIPAFEIRVEKAEPVLASATDPREPFVEPAGLATVASGDATPPRSSAVPPVVPVEAQVTPAKPAPRERTFLVWQHARGWCFLGLWISGFSVLACRLCLGHRRVKRLVSTSQPASDTVLSMSRRVASALRCKRNVRVQTAAGLSAPVLTGLRRPVLLLPERMCDRSYNGELPAIIAHELAHVLSSDLLWGYVLHWLYIALWFHPLVWGIRAAHASACEQVSDAISAGFLGDAHAYSCTLARVAVDAISHPQMVGGIPMARAKDISRRLRILERKVFSAPLSRTNAVAFMLVGLLAVALVGSVRMRYADGTEDRPDVMVTKRNVPLTAKAVKHKPLADPNPELTKRIMDRLEGNYRNVRDLQYTVVVEFDEPHDHGNVVKEMYVKFPDEAGVAADDVQDTVVGGARKFRGKLRMDIQHDDMVMRATLDNGVLVSLLEVDGRQILDGVRVEEMSGRFEAFDSIFFFDYVVSEASADKGDTYLLKAHRGTLRVDKETFRPKKVAAYHPGGELDVEQEFIDFHEFPELGFSFPKTIRTAYFTNGKLRSTCLSHIKDVKINSGLRNRVFMTESAPPGPKPVKRNPLVDPNPEMTRKIMDRLKGNYRNVRDLEYTLVLESDDEYHDKLYRGAVKQTYIKFPNGATAAVRDIEDIVPGSARRFPGKVRMDVHRNWEGTVEGGEWVTCPVTSHATLVDGLGLGLFELFGHQVLSGVKHEETWACSEAFDSVFSFNYVLSEQGAENSDTYLLKAHRRTLSVDNETFRPRKVLSYFPDGLLNLEQEFIDFHEFPELGFSFPKTMKTTHVLNWYNRHKPPATVLSHIKDVKINQGLKDDIFSDMSQLRRAIAKSDINEKVAQLDIDTATFSDVIRIFGEPVKYSKGKKVLTKDSLPEEYTAVYPDGFNVHVRGDSIVGLRFYMPGYLFRGTVQVGSSLEEVFEVVGQPAETVEGKARGSQDGVLYKDVDGMTGYCFYERADQGVRFLFWDYKVFVMHLTRGDGDEAPLAEKETASTSKEAQRRLDEAEALYKEKKYAEATA